MKFIHSFSTQHFEDAYLTGDLNPLGDGNIFNGRRSARLPRQTASMEKTG
jgi:hypothetical protein